MELFSYIMTVTYSPTDSELYLAIKNLAETGRVHYGQSDGFRSIELWIIPKSRKRKEELLEQLQALAPIEQVSLVSLSNPASAAELLQVRELFNNMGLNSRTVNDENLSLFLQTRLEGKYSYLIYTEQGQDRTCEIFRIIKAEEHPLFKPEWLVDDTNVEELLDRELTIEDLEIRTVWFQMSEEEAPPEGPNAGGEELPNGTNLDR